MKRLCYILLFLLNPVLLIGQGLRCYEYWVDDDFTSRRVVNSSSTKVTINMSYAKQTSGLHYLNFRSQSSTGDWSALRRFLYYVPDPTDAPAATPTLDGYEYWTDEDYAGRRWINNNSGEFTVMKNVGDLPVGLHYLNFRTRNSNGDWSALKRLLFYVPNAREETEDSPMTSYKYRFNQKTTTIDIGQQTSYQLTDFTIDIPDLTEVGNLEDGCKFTFDSSANQVHLNRTQAVSFTLLFEKENGVQSMPVNTTFTMSDELDHEMLLLPLNGEVSCSKTSHGDFAAFRIDLKDEEEVHIKVTQPCTVQLFEIDGSLASEPLAVNGKESATMILPDGTYYGLVYNMVQDANNPYDHLRVKLHAGGYAEVLASIGSASDVQDFVNSLDDIPCTAETPLTIPVIDGYLLTEHDYSYIRQALPEGYSCFFDPLGQRLLVYVIPDILGDVNGDGKVNITDVTSIISFILGQKPAGFVESAANTNGDGKIDIVDVTTTIELILKASQ